MILGSWYDRRPTFHYWFYLYHGFGVPWRLDLFCNFCNNIEDSSFPCLSFLNPNRIESVNRRLRHLLLLMRWIKCSDVIPLLTSHTLYTLSKEFEISRYSYIVYYDFCHKILFIRLSPYFLFYFSYLCPVFCFRWYINAIS